MPRSIFHSLSDARDESISGGAAEFSPPGCFDGQAPCWPASWQVNCEAARSASGKKGSNLDNQTDEAQINLMFLQRETIKPGCGGTGCAASTLVLLTNQSLHAGSPERTAFALSLQLKTWFLCLSNQKIDIMISRQAWVSTLLLNLCQLPVISQFKSPKGLE